MPVSTSETLSEEVSPEEQARQVLSILSKRMLKLGMYFQWYLFQKLPVYYVEDSKSRAWTDGVAIYVTPAFLSMPPNEQLTTLRHELYHVALQHPLQLRRRLSRIRDTYERNLIDVVYNVLADAVVNGLIQEENAKLGLGPVTDRVLPSDVDPILEDDVKRMGFGNALDKLLTMIRIGLVEVAVYAANGRQVDLRSESIRSLAREHGALVAVIRNKRTNYELKILIEPDLHSPCGGSGGSDGEGTGAKLVKKPLGGSVNPGDIPKLVREAIDFHKQQEISRRGAGLGLSEGFVQELSETTPRRAEWEALLTNILRTYLSRFEQVSWAFVNRRAPFVKPGVRFLTYPEIHILLDTSGSMIGEPLERALRRVLYVAETYGSTTRIRLYRWSDGATLPEDIDRRFARNVMRYKRFDLKISGGTRLSPAIDVVMKYASPTSCVIILTDGEIYEFFEEEAKERLYEKLKRLASRVHTVIFASLGYIPKDLPRSIFRVKLEED